jgi:hypothetical protein
MQDFTIQDLNALTAVKFEKFEGAAFVGATRPS